MASNLGAGEGAGVGVGVGAGAGAMAPRRQWMMVTLLAFLPRHQAPCSTLSIQLKSWPKSTCVISANTSVTSKHKSGLKKRIKAVVKESASSAFALVSWRDSWEKAEDIDRDATAADLLESWKQSRSAEQKASASDSTEDEDNEAGLEEEEDDEEEEAEEEDDEEDDEEEEAEEKASSSSSSGRKRPRPDDTVARVSTRQTRSMHKAC